MLPTPRPFDWCSDLGWCAGGETETIADQANLVLFHIQYLYQQVGALNFIGIFMAAWVAAGLFWMLVTHIKAGQVSDEGDEED
jgi:hypothetical protein